MRGPEGLGPVPRDPDSAAWVEAVRSRLLENSTPATPAAVAAAVNAQGTFLGPTGTLDMVEYISAELTGLGPLQPLADTPAVTDILVNGPQEIWVEAGRGFERSDVGFANEEAVRALAVRLVHAGGRRLDDASPCVDVRLSGGYRVHAILPPVAVGGTKISVRVRSPEPLSILDLQHRGMISAHMIQVCTALVLTRANFLISGSTGAGKTTLLSALLALCPGTERLVLVEDAAELDPEHPHVVTLEARHANAEGVGEISLQELVRQALRMRPDRLVVGECRGAEVRDLMMALNTGHSGAGTVHANSAADVPARLEALGALAGLSPSAVAVQAASAIQVILHVAVVDGRRRLMEIALMRLKNGRLVAESACEYRNGLWQDGPAWREFSTLLDGAPRPSRPVLGVVRAA